MDNLERRVKDLLEEKNQSFNWLSDQIGYSRQGLKSGLTNKTIKMGALEKLAEVLEVDINVFFADTVSSQVSLDNFFENEFVKFISDRYNSFYEKLALYKDVFVWKVLTLTASSKDIVFPYIDPDKWSEAISTEHKQKISNFPVEMIDKPYTKWGIHQQIEFKTEFRIIDIFYEMMFKTNFFNICDLLQDGIIKDKEMIEFYKKWEYKPIKK